MAAIILKRPQSQCPAPAPERPPRLEMEWDHEQKRFRVQVGNMYSGWFVDIPSNRKAVVVFLREMYDSETGRLVFTEEELAGLLGSANRQAVDGHMKGFRDADGNLLHIEIYPSNNGTYCELFLLELKRKGYRPYVIVTDGWDAYIEAIQTVFPHARHLLCRFHLIRSVFRRMRQITFFDTQISKRLGKLFRSDDPRTVRRRVAALHAKLLKSGKQWVLEGLLAKLEQVMPAVGNPTRWPSTSNAAEWFFGAYDRFYRLKGPFQDERSARKLTALFVLGYVFRMGLASQACPLERTQTDVSMIPFYHLINRPKLLKLQELIAEQYDGICSAE